MLRKLLIALVALAVLGGSIGTTAQAKQVNPVGKPVAKMTLQEKVKYYKANVEAANNTLNWFHSKKANWMLNGKRYPAAHSQAIPVIRFHQRLLKNATRNLKAVEAKLAPPLPAHYAGWMCIHGDSHYRNDGRGEGAWYSVNPNGHYNGLQMSYGWGEGIVGNPNNYTPMEIMWAAERGYQHAAQRGELHSWLLGQWGQTIGPCWKYF